MDLYWQESGSLNMLFPRRTWALRVTESMGLSGGSRETHVLVDMLIWSAKQEEAMLKAAGNTFLTRPESILMGSISMVNSHSAVSYLANGLGIDQPTALLLLAQMQAAGLELIKKHEFASLEQLARRKNLL